MQSTTLRPRITNNLSNGPKTSLYDYGEKNNSTEHQSKILMNNGLHCYHSGSVRAQYLCLYHFISLQHHRWMMQTSEVCSDYAGDNPGRPPAEESSGTAHSSCHWVAATYLTVTYSLQVWLGKALMETFLVPITSFLPQVPGYKNNEVSNGISNFIFLKFRKFGLVKA